MFFVYVISSQMRSYLYVGLTNNLKRRISQHQQGKERTTRPFRPFKLIYHKWCPTRQEARNREKYLKSGVGKEWIKKYILKKHGDVAKSVDLPAGRQARTLNNNYS